MISPDASTIRPAGARPERKGPRGRLTIANGSIEPSTWLCQVLRCAPPHTGDSPKPLAKASRPRGPQPASWGLKYQQGKPVMWTIHTEVKMTRRKAMCHVMDENEVVLWSGAGIGAALRFLRDRDQINFKIDGPAADQQFTLTFRQL